MRYLLVALAFITVTITSCSISKSSLSEYTSKMDKEVSFSQDILPIMERSCKPCHFPGGKVEELSNAEEAREEIDEIIYRIELPEGHKKYMPFKKKKPSLSQAEINMFKEWAVKGFKE